VSDLEGGDNSALEVSPISGQTQPYVVPATLANGTGGTAYSATLSAAGGNAASRQWSVASGALPPGLSLDAAAGTVSGTPTSSTGSPFTFGIVATDTASGHASQARVFTLGVLGPDLTVTSTHTGTFTQGQIGATYSITVTNSGTGPTSGTVTVVDTLPAGLTATAIGGTGWGCTLTTLTCTRGDALSAGGSYALTVTVNVASNAPASVINHVTVTGGGSTMASANDPTAILSFSPCDVNQDGITDVVDVQRIVNEALGISPAVNDLNQDGAVNVADIQKAINATLGLGCPVS